MDPKSLGDLVIRIDERTANMEKRQIEEAAKREALSGRVDSLEAWKNRLLGAQAAVMAALGGLGIYVKAKH